MEYQMEVSVNWGFDPRSPVRKRQCCEFGCLQFHKMVVGTATFVL